MDKAYQYDVALSFAGENRPYVTEVARLLRAQDTSVFFDDFESVELWGQDLAVHLDDVYRNRARFVVPFISQHYAAKAWPQLEFRSALARAVEERGMYLLPVRHDDTELPGLRPTVGYLDARVLTPGDVAGRILAKLGRGAGRATAVPAGTPIPRPAPSDFNPYEEAERAVSSVGDRLSAKAEALRDAGYAVHAKQRDSAFSMRVMRGGHTLYSLDVWIGHEWGENTICFYGARGSSTSPGATNAHGRIEWDRASGGPKIKLMNMSLLQQMAAVYRLSAAELGEEIWTEIMKVLDEGA